VTDCVRAAGWSTRTQVAIDLRGGVSGATATLLLRVLVDSERVVLVADPAGLVAAVLPPGGATNVNIRLTNTGNVPSGCVVRRTLPTLHSSLTFYTRRCPRFYRNSVLFEVLSGEKETDDDAEATDVPNRCIRRTKPYRRMKYKKGL
jgi:hypothetical protein